MSYLDKVESCNRRDLHRLVPFAVEDVQYGWLAPERAAMLLDIPAVFAPLRPDTSKAGVTLVPGVSRPGLASAAGRSAAIADVVPVLVGSGLFQTPRQELYAVKNRWSDAEICQLDRALVPGFGARAYGVHMNGFVRKKDGIHLWIGTRALDRQVEPGKLDNIVAGGQPAGLALRENLIKECGEEAGIEEPLARQARPVSLVTYAFEAREGLKADTLFCYDLELGLDFRPQVSEEITAFALMPIADVLALIRDTDRFKFNVNLVILDFAIRHGVIDPDRERDFEAIARGLREAPQPIV